MGVHTTQFAIRKHGLYEPVLALAAETMRGREVVRIAGVCGLTQQAIAEAQCAADLGYHAALLARPIFRSFSSSTNQPLLCTLI